MGEEEERAHWSKRQRHSNERNDRCDIDQNLISLHLRILGRNRDVPIIKIHPYAFSDLYAPAEKEVVAMDAPNSKHRKILLSVYILATTIITIVLISAIFQAF